MLWQRRGKDIECLQFNIEDGVLQPGGLILHFADTGNLIDVGMEKEDPGPMMSMF